MASDTYWKIKYARSHVILFGASLKRQGTLSFQINSEIAVVRGFPGPMLGVL